MKAGIIGIPGAGRRTLFYLLTRAAEARPGHQSQIGVLKIHDARLNEVARIQASRKVTPATIEFALVPGLVKGESREKLDLPSIRNVDALVHVVRSFEEPSVPHPETTIAPARDIEMVELELALADLGVIEKRIERLRNDAKKGNKFDPSEMALLERSRDALQEGTPLRAILTDEERNRLRGYALLTAKPCLLVVNVGEDRPASDPIRELGLEPFVQAPGLRLCFVSARIEAEIAELSPEDARVFREDLGLHEGTVERLVRESFELMNMLTFFTAEKKEARAWVVARGTRALAAAGTVHSDMERGFIRAEVVPYDRLVAEGSWSACRDKGILRLEGKDYPVADGDVIYFRFNV
jgi:GTP-binding protein YchF